MLVECTLLGPSSNAPEVAGTWSKRCVFPILFLVALKSGKTMADYGDCSNRTLES